MKVAIIPARGGSKRIPRKNMKMFCGKPIISYSIESALSTGLFDEVFVSTSGDIQRNRVSLGLSPLDGLTVFYLLETNFNDVTEYRNIVGLDYRFNP